MVSILFHHTSNPYILLSHTFLTTLTFFYIFEINNLWVQVLVISATRFFTVLFPYLHHERAFTYTLIAQDALFFTLFTCIVINVAYRFLDRETQIKWLNEWTPAMLKNYKYEFLTVLFIFGYNYYSILFLYVEFFTMAKGNNVLQFASQYFLIVDNQMLVFFYPVNSLFGCGVWLFAFVLLFFATVLFTAGLILCLLKEKERGKKMLIVSAVLAFLACFLFFNFAYHALFLNSEFLAN